MSAIERLKVLYKERYLEHHDIDHWQEAIEKEWPKIMAVFEAIEGHDIEGLKKKVTYLKQTDGEGWAVGEMLRRALEL